MSIDFIVLLAIAVILYLLYKKLSDFVDVFNGDSSDNKNELINWLKSIDSGTHSTSRKVKEIELICKAMIPPDGGSMQRRKRENFIQIYSKHLVEVEKMQPKDALARARFEIWKFDNDDIEQDMEREEENREAELAEKVFISTESFEKDIKNFWTTGDAKGNKWINPHDLFEPVYALSKSDHFDGDKTAFVIDWEADRDYYSYVRNRAIIRKLENLGIVGDFNDKSDSRFNLYPKVQRYKLKVGDMKEIENLIFKDFEHGSNITYLEEKWNENRIQKIFKAF